MRFANQLLDVRSLDPDDARRRTLLNILVAGVTVLSLVGLLVTGIYALTGLSTLDEVLRPFLACLAAGIGMLVIYVLNRYVSGWLASFLFLLIIVIGAAFTDTPQEIANGRSLIVFAIPIVMGSIILPPVASFLMAGLSSLVITAVGLSAGVVPNMFAMAIFFMVGLVAWLSARSLERALADLRQTNVELDQRVDERTMDLAEALAREHAEANKNQAILDSIADGVIVFNNQNEAVLANPAIGHILEQPIGKILDADIRILLGEEISPEDQQRIVEFLEDRETRHSGVKFDLGEKTLSVSFAPVLGASDEVTGSVAVFRDFTREAEIDRMKSDFVSIVSHELRTPLTSIKGYLELLLMGAAGSINKQQGSFLEIAKGNAERLHELVSDLLDISRIESGKAELDVQVVSLADIVEQVANTLQNEFAERGLTLTIDVPPDLPEFFGDPGRIAQILTNLMGNAYKYTSEGGATVRARAAKDVMQIDVIDTGFGISEEDIEKLFTRFFRAEDHLIRQQPGTGLGLNITKSLVDMHDGEIWVESELGVGSTFSFSLPLPAGLMEMQADGEQIQPTPALMPVKEDEVETLAIPAGPWVLVVDDDPDVARLFQHQLQRAGYRVTIVNQGSRVVEVARQLKPELITLDLLMDVDGLTVLQQLKADPVTTEIPVIIISVVPEAQDGIALGAADYLVKPLDEGELLSRVRHVLDQLNGESQNRILVVDDEIDIVGWLKHSLTHYGYDVTEAFDGVQALEAVQAEKPDLILLDMRMPRMDGRTTIRRLRENQDTRHIPIIVLSANPMNDDADRAQMVDLGVKEFLRKPVTVDQLVTEVQKHLGQTGAT